MPGTVVLTANVLEYLIRNERLSVEFPFMRYAAKAWDTPTKKGGCGNCRKRRPSPQDRNHILGTVKAHLMSLEPDRKALFKSIAGIDELVVQYVHNGEQSQMSL